MTTPLRLPLAALAAAALLGGCGGGSVGSPSEITTDQDAVTASSIAGLALGNLGKGACSTNSLGGRAYGSSCTGNGGQPEYWCADFARWVWANAGVPDVEGLTAAAGSFYVYGQRHGTLHANPRVGDAVVFNYRGGGYASHVALVTRVNGDGTIETASGDWGGHSGSQAYFASTSHVVLNAPAYPGRAGSYAGIIGMTISGFISPAGVTSGAPAPAPASASQYVALLPAKDGQGYWLVASDGGVFSYGSARFFGSMGGKQLSAPIVGGAVAPDGQGYWLLGADGGIFAFGSAGFHGSTGDLHLNAPVVGMAAAPDGQGYWLVASDGGLFAFGSAGFFGSMGGTHLNAPVVGMAATPDGRGYWLVASDGGIFAFGSAGFHGSTGSMHLNAPVTGIAATADGQGYWLVATDGGLFAFGSAGFQGSMGGSHLNAPVGAIAATPDGAGYWLLGRDGGLFSFGSAGFYGSRG